MRYTRVFGAFVGFVFLLFGPTVQADDRLPYHDAQVVFDPATRNLEVVDRITLPPATELTFRLANWLQVDRAEADGVALSVRRIGRLWQATSPNGSIETVTVRLSGKVPEMPPPDQRRRTRGAVVDPEEGSYLPGYVAWLPDTGADRITYRLETKITGSQRAVATGRIISEFSGENTSLATFAVDNPAELPSLFVGPYVVEERVIDGIRLRTYFHEDIADASDHYLTASADYINMFAAQIGDYPFDSFHIVSAPLPVGLGFPNMTYIGRVIVPLPFMRGRSLAHEVLHNWWGNGVAVDYDHGNWAEGLTTYFADYGLAQQQGPEAAREMRLGWLRDYAALPASDDGAVSAFTAKTHQASQIIGYNKLTHIFHMLRHEIGDSAFEQGVRSFWQGHKFNIAAWSDLQQSFEKTAGRDLDWFFAQWRDQVGAPEIELADVQATFRDGLHTLSLTLRQNGSPYRLKVPVIIETAMGEVRHVVDLSGADETISLMLDSAALRVQVDPDFDVFRRLLPGESPTILRDITLAPEIETMVLGEDVAFKKSSLALAGRLSRKVSPVSVGAPVGPTIVIGDNDDIEKYLAQFLSTTIPEQVKNGSAAAWTVQSPDGHPVLMVRGDDTAAIDRLLRPLPHYGSRSYIAFDGSRALDKGVWQLDDSPLNWSLDRS
jgi:aminopeptidase N